MKLEELYEGKMLDKLKGLFNKLMGKQTERHTHDDEDFDFATDGEYETAAKMLKTVTNSALAGIGVEKNTGAIHVLAMNGKEFIIKDGEIKFVGHEFDEEEME